MPIRWHAHRRTYDALEVLLVALWLADAVTTWAGLQLGLGESNPAFLALAGATSAGVAFAAKLLVGVLMVGMCEALYAIAPRLAYRTLLFVDGLLCAIVLWNVAHILMR